MKTKIKLFLTDDLFAILSIELALSKDQQTKAEIAGIGEQEQINLVGQAMQTILAMLGNSDEA